MTKLDLVLARLKELPPERQDMIAVEIAFMLDHDDGGKSFLTPEQWAEVTRRMNDPEKRYVAHEDVVAQFEEKFGR